MTKEGKILGGIAIGSLLFVILGAIFFSGQGAKESTEPQPSVDSLVLANKDAHSMGAENPKVEIVEFSDFECPGCASAASGVGKVVTEFSSQVRFTYRHFPLPFHKNAKLAAKASESAGEQNKFWEMHIILFEKQKDWADKDNAKDIFISYAKDLGLDENKFKSDIESNKYDERIEKDISDGIAAGVDSTPTFYINGKKYAQVFTYESLKQVIEPLLQ